MTTHLTARDIGMAIRDYLEDRQVCKLTENNDGEMTDTGPEVNFVDVSEPSAPIVHLDNGQIFFVRISHS